MEKRYISLENSAGQVVVDLLRKGYGASVEVTLTGSEIRIRAKTKLHHTLSTWEEEEFIVHLPDDEDAPNEQEEGEDDDGGEDDDEAEGDNEAAILAGMEGGASGYNAARGYDTEEPEPCGHHCDSDCPRCGI